MAQNEKMLLYGFSILCISAVLAGSLIYTRYYTKAAKLDTYLTAWTKKGTFSGSVLVAQKGKILLCKGYGMANYEHMVPNTPETKFDIGSITKQFTSMAIMQLVQMSKLKLTDTIASIFPDYPRDNEITIYQLLTHTAGVPDHEQSIELDYSRPSTDADFNFTKPVTINDIIEWVKHKPLEFAPGSAFKYCNTGYVLLAAIIEKLSGKSYETYVKEHIFKPLGMNNSGMLNNTQLILHRAQGYHKTDTGLVNAQYYDPSVDIGSGALYSTVQDLYLWDRALYTDKLLCHDLRMQLWQPNRTHYGLGWHVGSIYEHRYVKHAGGWFDCSTIIMRFIDDDLCIIILGNLDPASSPVDRIANDIAAIIFNQRYELPRTAIHVDTSLYDSYVGTYKLEPDLIIEITKHHGHLFVQVAGQSADKLTPESETEFFNEFVPVRLSFIKDTQKTVTQLVGHQDGHDFIAKKIT